MVSLRDVAEHAGVSPATVSRVLSDSSHPVTATTRDKVMRAVSELNFTPNLLARGLVTKRTNSIGVIVHDIADPYFGEIVRGLEDAAHDAGYQVVTCSSDREVERELTYVETLLAHQVDAVVLAGGGLEDAGYQQRLAALLDGYRDNNGVVVLLGPNAYPAANIAVDNRGGAEAMTGHLLELGHVRIGFVGGPAQLRTSEVRLQGYRDALEQAGLAFDEELVVSGDFTIDGGRRAVRELLRRRSDVTAVFCANDLMAFGALAELRERDVAVPEQVSVAGYDDIHMAHHMNPPLTTVAIDMYRLGHEGFRMALAHLEDGARSIQRWALEVVERGSTAPPPGRERDSGG